MGCFQSKNPPPSDNAPKSSAAQPAQPASQPTAAPVAKSSAPPPTVQTSAVPKPFQHKGKTVYHYFDVHGRGEIVRMMLHLTDVPFEDHRFGFEEWMKLKATAEFGTCPILEIDGHRLVQTKSIIRYIAQMHGLYPTALKDVYLMESFVDEVCDIREDLIEHSAHQLTDKLAEHYAKMPTLLPLLEKRLNGNPARSGWVVGGNMTLADMMLFDLLWNWFLSPDRKAEHADKVSKRLKEFAEFFLSRYPKMREYVSNRQSRPF